MKWLFLCEGGNCRSVAFAWAMKVRGIDALAGSTRYNTSGTLRSLFEWADRQVLLDAALLEALPVELRVRVQLHDIGPDRWGFSTAPELAGLAAAYAAANAS